MRLPRAAKQLSILRETVSLLAGEVDEQRRIESIFLAFEKLGFIDGIRSRLAVVADDESVLVIKHYQGDHGSANLTDLQYHVGEGFTGYAAQRGDSLIISDYLSFPSHVSPYSQHQIQSLMAIPLKHNGKVVGVLSFDSNELNAFHNEAVSALEPYVYLLASTLRLNKEPKQANVISYISQSRRRQVLVLGKDTGEELQRLTALCTGLKALGYIPLLVKDYPDIPELSNEEKVRVFADASRFVILENSFPSGQIAECKMCATNRIITAALRENDKGSSFMVTDYFKDFDFMEEFKYDEDSLQEALKSAVTWAEEKIQERIQYYDSVYPWRNKNTSSGDDA